MSEKLVVGAKASLKKSFSDQDVRKFAEVSEDANPIHLDEAAASESIFKQRVVHGALVSSLFSAILGCDLPGQGTIFLGQTVSFKAPVFLNEEIEASVEVMSIHPKRAIVTFKLLALNPQGKVVIEGEAKVMALKHLI
ncbi:enoyl-CoA hydratase [Thalassotalea sp. 42_200_T64]|nr:enoyl-CoA hydratase [Thalassotalea sp. 42_200_T64]